MELCLIQDNFGFQPSLEHSRPEATLELLYFVVFTSCSVSNPKREKKAIRNLLGYWNSVGGVRFWAIATLWWFWCMTSVSGIVVVPVKNMFWLRFGVAVHPKQSIETELPIRVQIMMSMDEWWWKSEENEIKNGKLEKIVKSNEHKNLHERTTERENST